MLVMYLNKIPLHGRRRFSKKHIKLLILLLIFTFLLMTFDNDKMTEIDLNLPLEHYQPHNLNLPLEPNRSSAVIDSCRPTEPGYQNQTEKPTAVLSVAVGDGMSMDLALCIPFVVAAWQRIGWSVTVLVVGDIQFWNTSRVLHLVYMTAYEIASDVHFIFIPAKANAVIYSYVARVFAVMATNWLKADDILITADANVLPLSHSIYSIDSSDSITLINTNCCDTFTWNNINTNYLPVSSIAMTSNNWNTVLKLDTTNKTALVDYINKWLTTKTDGKTIPDVQLGPDKTDEYVRMVTRVVSIQIHNSELQKYRHNRKIGNYTVDNSDWDSLENFSLYTDVRIALPPLRGNASERMIHLSKTLFNHCVVEKLVAFQTTVDQNIS